MINLLKEEKETISKSDLENLSVTMNAFVFDVLGLVDETQESGKTTNKLEEVVDLLIDMRNEARANKNFALSDEIRDKLLAIGIQLKDGKEGTSFSL